MHQNIQEKAFLIIDEFLSTLASNPKGGWFKTLGQPSEYLFAKQIMDEHQLISYRNPGNRMSISDISSKGLEVIRMGGIKKYLSIKHGSSAERESLELQQLRTNVELLKSQYFNYEKDRARFIRNEWAVWIGMGISIISLLISLAFRK